MSDSVVRRVALPDAFFALDGLFETFLTVLDEFGAFPAIIERENERYLPFLATTKVLMAAVRAGVGREVAHEAIKESAVAVALAMRAGRRQRPDRPAGRRPAARPRPGRHRRGHRQPARPRRAWPRARSTRSSPWSSGTSRRTRRPPPTGPATSSSRRGCRPARCLVASADG